MDYVGILKEAWTVTWRNKALWVLGLFTAGSAGASSFNWNMGGTQEGQGTTYDLQGVEDLPPRMEQFAREVEALVEHGTVPEWLPLVFLGMALLIVLGIVFWVIGIAARGGIVEQTDVALAGGDVSARQGWRTGFKRWGRVFLVGLVLALPALAIVLASMLILGVIAVTAAGVFQAGPDAGWPALLGLGAIVPFLILALMVVAVIIGIIQEVAYRHAVLGELTALEAVKASWHDLRAKRGMATMWLVMLLVGIGAGIVSGLIMIPVLIAAGLVTAAAYMAAGMGGLWALLPMGLIVLAVGMLVKAVYATFFNTAWTSFYRRMQAPADATETVDAVVEPAEGAHGA